MVLRYFLTRASGVDIVGNTHNFAERADGFSLPRRLCLRRIYIAYFNVGLLYILSFVFYVCMLVSVWFYTIYARCAASVA